ncbi:hypothetical protein EYB33_00740 (plasmid) [Lysinibacillus sphaericus]|uniref:hypothetical protein n=1 Tax=Lysinibacillus sphaericus TaxID=1421 RepID=UPI001E4FF72E|nr:hypothetical protein [Lysinibacillus sphaericus]UDK94900.1 hypothetical protein EYB33_00740 [Lysinibacillus sphaericus]
MRNEVITSEIASIVKQMTTENQQYFLTLVRVAAVAENAVKRTNDMKSLKKI